MGYEEREYGIKVGTWLTAYGDVIYDIASKKLMMPKP